MLVMRISSLVVLMVILGWGDSVIQCPSRDNLQFPFNLTEEPGQPIRSQIDSLEPLYNFARLFLEAVQPNDFPFEIASKASRNEEQDTSEVARYEAGYVVCLILALLYVIIMPVMGAVLAWRYFHPKTNSLETIPSSSPSSSSSPPLFSSVSSQLPWYRRDITLLTCMSAVTILLLAGVTLTFTTNNRVRENMRPNLYHLRNNAGDIWQALEATAKRIDTIVDQFSTPQTNITEEVNETGIVIGEAIISSFSTQVNNALRATTLTVQDVTDSRDNLLNIKTLRTQMRNRETSMYSGLQQLRQRVESIKINCSQSCNLLNTTNLETDADYDQLPDVNIGVLGTLPSLDNVVEQANSSFHSIPQITSRQIEPNVAEVVFYLNITREIFENSSRRFPSLESLSDAAADFHSAFSLYGDDIDYYDYVRWAVAVLFCTLILVIVFLMTAALSMGIPMTVNPTVYPAHLETQIRLTAVYLLRAAVGLTFLFSWLFIIMVFIALFFGGNAHTLACRSWINGELFQFLDTQDNLFSSLKPSNESDIFLFYNISRDANSTAANTTQIPITTTGSPRTTTTPPYNTTQAANSSQDHPVLKLNISTAEIYHGCSSGISLFYTMHMNEIFNMDQFLNASLYMRRFNESIEDLSIDLTDLRLLPQYGRQAVINFKNRANLDRINYAAFRHLLQQPVMKKNLTAFANDLEAVALMQGNEVIRTELLTEAQRARNLSLMEQHQRADAREMSSNVEALNEISVNYKTNADRTLQSTQQIENDLKLQAPHIVENVSMCLLGRGQELLQQYLNWVRHVIVEEVLDCRWLPVALDNVYTAACQNIISPWNAFWLCLGWCCAFLVPAVIFSIYTARLWQPTVLAISRVPFGWPEDTSKDMSKDNFDWEKTANPKSNIYMTLDDIKNMQSCVEASQSEKGCDT